MKTIGNYRLIFLLTFLCMACSTPSRDVELLLDRVESIVEQQPDSALTLLHTMGVAYRKTGAYNNAKKSFREAFSLCSDSSEENL